MRPRTLTGMALTGALLGLLFAAVSTYDFVQHLDRQVHDLHCSFVPGLGGAAGATGCQETMMSSYSSVLRKTLWGGIPISLPAMAVFAFLLFFAAELLITGRCHDRRATGFLVLATALPALSSGVMAYVSLVTLGAACKLCIGIYFASGVCLGAALRLWTLARRADSGRDAPAAPGPNARAQQSGDPAWTSPSSADRANRDRTSGERQAVPAAPTSSHYLIAVFIVGLLFVATPVLAYVAAVPDHRPFIDKCGVLDTPEDRYGVMIAIGPPGGSVPAIEVLDPLCPACRAFEARLTASGLDRQLARRALLFPLDNQCNWMVDAPIHPGACAVAEAVLCGKDRSDDILTWAFANQAGLRSAAARDDAEVRRLIVGRFPTVASCLGSPEVRARLNKSLRWAVANQLSVLTPQLYVGAARLCDEDVDIGMDYALAHLIKAYREHGGPTTSVPTRSSPPVPAAAEPPPLQAGTAAGPVPPRPGNALDAGAGDLPILSSTPGAVPKQEPGAAPARGLPAAADGTAEDPPRTEPDPPGESASDSSARGNRRPQGDGDAPGEDSEP
jgi:uncharacterized membrane protein